MDGLQRYFQGCVQSSYVPLHQSLLSRWYCGHMLQRRAPLRRRPSPLYIPEYWQFPNQFLYQLTRQMPWLKLLSQDKYPPDKCLHKYHYIQYLEKGKVFFSIFPKNTSYEFIKACLVLLLFHNSLIFFLLYSDFVQTSVTFLRYIITVLKKYFKSIPHHLKAFSYSYPVL